MGRYARAGAGGFLSVAEDDDDVRLLAAEKRLALAVNGGLA